MNKYIISAFVIAGLLVSATAHATTEPSCSDEYEDIAGGASHLNFIPKLSGKVTVDNRSITFLGNRLSFAGLVLSSESQDFPIDEYGQPIMTWMPVQFGAEQSYGYEHSFTSTVEGTFHTLYIDDSIPAGTYYIRVYIEGYNYGLGVNEPQEGQFPWFGPVFSQEVQITIN